MHDKSILIWSRVFFIYLKSAFSYTSITSNDSMTYYKNNKSNGHVNCIVSIVFDYKHIFLD